MPPARSKARKRALDILFEAEQRGSPVLDLLAERHPLGKQLQDGQPAQVGLEEHVKRPLARLATRRHATSLLVV